jgi:hypothetical protein
MISQKDIFELIVLNEQERIESVIDRKDISQSSNTISKVFNRLEFYKDGFNDMLKDGYIMKYPHGTVIRQADRKYHYRGENTIFPTSKPTFIRKVENLYGKEKQVEEFVANLKLVEFFFILQRLNHFHEFQNMVFTVRNTKVNIDVLFYNVAQHYGFDTNWLDITSDFDVALFFACCKYRNNQWQPLKQSDFCKGEQSKYGRIFRRKADDFRNFLFPETKYTVFPVGFQSFKRCHMQYSYAIAMDEGMDLLNSDSGFECLAFEHSEEMSNYIFNKMKGGELIYPHEGLNVISKDLDLIKSNNNFSKAAFDEVSKIQHLGNSKPETIRILEKYGYAITNHPIIIEHQR